jgi:hypothetical protein
VRGYPEKPWHKRPRLCILLKSSKRGRCSTKNAFSG